VVTFFFFSFEANERKFICAHVLVGRSQNKKAGPGNTDKSSTVLLSETLSFITYLSTSSEVTGEVAGRYVLHSSCAFSAQRHITNPL
jgi:hypothetical protein